MNRLKRLLFRSLRYYRCGAGLVSMPFSIIGIASSFYTLVRVIEWTKMLILFPTFETFVYISVPIYFFGAGVIGYLYLKSPFYKKGDRDVDMLRDPMMMERFAPINTLGMIVRLDHWKKEGVDPILIEKIEVIVEDSINYWRSRGVKLFD